ncbi:MAG TPA: O-antigen ligase family protein [Edaphobacter sp.]|nr:O-antigen ligase family protein [Edaphobacter sp.]
MTTTLQQPTSSTPHKIHSGFLLLPGLIGFLFSFRTCLAVLFFQENFSVGTAVSTSFTVVLLLAAAFFSVGGRPTLPLSCFRTTTLRWIAAFFAFALLSIFWSAAPLTEAFGFWIAWTADVLTIWFLLRNGVPEAQAAAVMKGYIWGACIVAIIAWWLPVMPDLRLGDVDYLHPNAIGFVTAIGTLMAMHLAHQDKRWRWPAFWLALTLIRTISKTSIIAFFVAMIFYLFKDRALTRATRIKIGLAAAVILGSLSGLLIAYFDAYAESTNPETLTGRTIIWATSGEIALEKPIFGHGFYSFHYVVPLFGEFLAAHAHNELLQQFFILGVAGVVLVVGLYWVFFRQIRRAPRSSLKTLAAGLLVFALVRGLADTERNDLSLPLWLMAMLSILLASQPIASTPPHQANPAKQST